MSSPPFVLAASAEMLYVDRPVADRVRAIHDAGFAVEIWDWRNHDLDSLEALAASGVVFTSMTGYTTGTLADEAGADELLRTAAESVVVSRRLGTPSLNLHGTGLDDRGLPVVPADEVTPTMWATARRTLGRIAELGEREGVTFVLENLNTAVDHPRTPFAHERPTPSTSCAASTHPHLRLNLDLYHAQIGEGNLIELCREALPWVAEVQVGRRARPVRAGHRRDPLRRGRPGPRGCRVHRRRRARGVRQRRPGCRAGRLPRGLHPRDHLPGRASSPTRPPGIPVSG